MRFSDSFRNKTTIMTRRMFILLSLKIVVFIGIVSRLFYLQISENIKYRSLSDKNRLREWKVAPQRGVIEDYFGNKIAKNKQVFELHMIPEDVPNIEQLFFKLARIINFTEKDKKNILRKLKKRKPWEPIIISDNLSWREFSRLNLYLHEIQGIKPAIALAREYTGDGVSSHIIGYVSEVSVKDLEQSKLLREINIPGLKTGKIGIEKNFNDSMIGTPGLQRFEVNAFGKRIKELKLINGIKGRDYRTTLDQEVQKYTSEVMEENSGSVCVMDIYTGDIVAMVSNPTFDANKFVHGISSSEWQELIEHKRKPLINKSVSGLYPPGSIIKPIVALSALENEVISSKLVIKCTGSIEFYGQKYHCWKKKGHGFMNLRNALKQSCDTYFYEVARRLGIDRLSVTAQQFGLGKKVLDFLNEEKPGVVPNTQWKLKNIGQNWYLGETIISGIGQGYFQTTPIQLCVMMAQLANGGYKIKPRISDDKYALRPTINAWRREFLIKKNNLDLPNINLEKLYKNKENIKLILDALYGATNEPQGTSYKSRLTKPEYIYAGKTGTSQVRSISAEQRRLELKNKDLPYEFRDHALFAGFAPYQKPRYAISVVIEHGGAGSSGAAPIAKKVLKKVLDRHKERKKYQLDLFGEA